MRGRLARKSNGIPRIDRTEHAAPAVVGALEGADTSANPGLASGVWTGSLNVAGWSVIQPFLENDQEFWDRAIDINQEDIESISVLKGAGATALYGSRAASGPTKAAIATTARLIANEESAAFDMP